MNLKITWLGQAGFVLEDEAGQRCVLDPYLSDWANREAGVARLAPPPVEATDLRPTVLVTSHWHEDHLDPDTISVIARSSPETTFVGPPANAARCRRWGVAGDRVVTLNRGEATTVGPFRVGAAFARHEVPGWLTEDAISIVVEVGGIRLFHSGDGEYDSRTVTTALAFGRLDIGLFAINGTDGNMNVDEAALLAARLGVREAIPMHYGMWAPENYGIGATLDPMAFDLAFHRLTGRHATILEPGRPTILRLPTTQGADPS